MDIRKDPAEPATVNSFTFKRQLGLPAIQANLQSREYTNRIKY